MTRGLVAVHAYRAPQDSPYLRPEKPVWEDRAEGAMRTLRTLRELGVDADLAFLGTPHREGKPLAHHIHRHAVSEGIVPEDETVHLLSDHGPHTRGEVEYLHTVAQKRELAVVISVSSRDHVPRIRRLWTDALAGQDSQPLISCSPSYEYYTQAQKDPYILEAAEYNAFISPLSRLFEVPEGQREVVAEAIGRTLDKYTRTED